MIRPIALAFVLSNPQPLQLQSVESVMALPLPKVSVAQVQKYFPDFGKPYVPLPPVWEALKFGEQLALLRLAGGELCLGVYKNLISNGACYPDARNYCALIELGYATKNKANRFHAATMRGYGAARELAKHIARERNWHVFWQNGGRFEVTLHCTCRESWALSKNQGHILEHRMRVEAKHLNAIEAEPA